MFYNIINLFIVTFDPLNAYLNKSKHIFKKILENPNF